MFNSRVEKNPVKSAKWKVERKPLRLELLIWAITFHFLAPKTAPVLTLQQHLRALVAHGLFALELSTFSLSLPYFTAPSKPRMNNFWAAKKTASTGSIRIIAPAATL